jgi:hypothetical protein
MQARWPRAIRAIALLFALLTLLLPWTALAGKRSMIPPGQEQRIREFVDTALAAARAANELPDAVDERVSIGIDRDRIRVILHPAGPADEPLPRLVVFHPEAVADDAGGVLAPGVTLECGPLELPSPCAESIATAWTPVAVRLASAREPVIEEVWQVEETGVQSHDATPSRRTAGAVWIDRGAVIAAVVLGLALLGFAMRGRSASDPLRVGKWELLALLGLLGLFVAESAYETLLLPLHEHNSFIARSDCAIDERCVTDPAGAWSMTTMHGYGLLLELIPYRVGALSRLSLAVSVIMLVLVWGLTRRLAVELGFSSAAGVIAVGVLASNPVIWRLSGAATFWPWTLSWTLAAALAGLWAARACASEHRRERLAGAAGWVLAAMSLAFAAAGNVVCLTLGACLVLGPLCWARAGALWRTVWIGPIAVGVFALLVAPDVVQGYERAFGPTGIDDSLTVERMIEDFNPLLLDWRIVTPVWALACIGVVTLAVARRVRRGAARTPGARGRALRLLAPIAYAYLVPAAYLGVAAHEVVGSGYPSGFINHHWELVFTAIAVGLALGWLMGLHRRAWLVPAGLTVLALLLAPLAREGWRMALGENVLERELVALERSFAVLPEHDVLVVAPRVLAPLTDAPSQWDPLEVVFPVGAYEYAMRERGLEPALVVSLDRLPERRPGERILLYVGSSLRSFQPHELAAGVVPDGLERPDVVRLRDQWTMEVVHEFAIRTEQHEAMSQRLAADRRGEIELGFYWLRPINHRSPDS